MEKVFDYIKQNKVVFILAVVILVLVVTLLIIWRNYRKKPRDPKEKIIVKKGVRYTKEDNINLINGDINITHKQGDVLLAAGKKRVATKNGALKPGKYTMLSGEQEKVKFNVRVGGFVKEFKHGQEIVLSEGDEITAVSNSIILR